MPILRGRIVSPDLANVRQMLGAAEGKQDELRAGNEKQLEELVALRLTLGQQETQLALLQRELELAQTASKQIQGNIALKSGAPKCRDETGKSNNNDWPDSYAETEASLRSKELICVA